MLCTFTTKLGNLVVRSDDIRAIEDWLNDETRLIYMIGNDFNSTTITGTAIENRDRIQQEELDLIDRVNQHHLKAQMQSQMQAQMAAQAQSVAPKVQRGRQS